MTIDELKKLIQEIVAESQQLSIKHTSEHKAPVNYACIFTQNTDEYNIMIKIACKIGSIVKDTATGSVYQITPLPTVAGTLKLLKIRQPDSKRKERGDADFTVTDYKSFKKTYLGRPSFSIITRPDMEMIELIDPTYSVIAYYSNPTLLSVLKVDIK